MNWNLVDREVWEQAMETAGAKGYTFVEELKSCSVEGALRALDGAEELGRGQIT